jgi:hydrogenase-4 component E
VSGSGLDNALDSLNALAGGLFLLSAFAMVATRQTRGCLQLFIAQSLLLAASAFLLGAEHRSAHLLGVGLVNLVTKPLLVPWILRRTLSEEVYARREIDQVLNIPSSLLIALALAVFAYFITLPILHAVAAQFRGANVPIGFAGLLLGAYTLAVRREAVPMLIGILAMENGAFFAGIALARDLPLIVELAVASDGLILVFVTGVLVRSIHLRIGSTRVGELAALREETTAVTAPRAGGQGGAHGAAKPVTPEAA